MGPFWLAFLVKEFGACACCGRDVGRTEGEEVGSDDAEGVSCCEEVDTGVDAADDEAEGVAGAPLNRFFTSNLGLLAAVAGLVAGV